MLEAWTTWGAEVAVEEEVEDEIEEGGVEAAVMRLTVEDTIVVEAKVRVRGIVVEVVIGDKAGEEPEGC